VAITTLRPSGRISLGGRLRDACTRGEFVEAGAQVRVVAVRGGTVEVEPTMPDAMNTPQRSSSKDERNA